MILFAAVDNFFTTVISKCNIEIGLLNPIHGQSFTADLHPTPVAPQSFVTLPQTFFNKVTEIPKRPKKKKLESIKILIIKRETNKMICSKQNGLHFVELLQRPQHNKTVNIRKSSEAHFHIMPFLNSVYSFVYSMAEC